MRWLARLGRHAEAVHAAYELRLIDDVIEEAWQQGSDVLALARVGGQDMTGEVLFVAVQAVSRSG